METDMLGVPPPAYLQSVSKGLGKVSPRRALRPAVFALALLAGCGGAPVRTPGAAPDDLAVFVGIGRQDGTQERTELWLRPAGDGWQLRARRAGAGTWPLLFDETAQRAISAEEAARLYRALLRANAFEVPTWLEDAPAHELPPLTLRVHAGGAFRQSTAVGRLDDRLVRTLRSIDRWSPLSLAPWPDWLAGLLDESDPRPRFTTDPEAAIRFHRDWLQDDPEFGRLHLDLFALFAHLGRKELARFELERLPADLAGIRGELERMLR